MSIKIGSSKHMDEALLREISEKYLLPFFSGATIESAARTSSNSDKLVAFVNPQVIGYKVHHADTYRLQFRRDQPFAQTSDRARETRVIEAFVEILGGMSQELRGDLKDDLLSTFQRRVVAHALAERGKAKYLLAVIDQMALWGTRLYEGAPIASAIGLDPDKAGSSKISLASVTNNDFGAVLSNGFDTLLVFDGDLRFSRHEVLDPSISGNGTCPWRHAAIAEWTSGGDGRVAVVLNRLGEILTFRDGQLLFARRGGVWHFLTHDPVIRQMGVPKNEAIRRAIYETALDASFARTGACLGVVRAGAGRSWEGTISKEDQLTLGLSDKARTMSKIIRGRKFHNLERTLRQELVAIDGATVINHEGEVLAVGAILKIDGGSTGGGRTAAAKKIARLGLGIKVSQDGGITAYRPEQGAARSVRTAFSVM